MAYGGEFIPPQYEDVVAEHSSLPGLLTSVDFIPACLEAPVFGNPKFEPFPILIERANEFLCKYPQWESKTCESIEFKCKHARVEPEKMTYYEPGENGVVIYIRGLRLWLVPRITQYPQQLGYINILPRVLNSGGLGWPDFQSLNETLQEFNEKIRHNPNLVPGKIITVETQEMKARTIDSFNPDKSCWREYGSGPKHYIIVMRVFYEKYIDTMGYLEREEIGIADFKPTMLDEGRIYQKPTFEPFSNVIQAASQWCSQQRSIRYCNAQTFEVKMKSGYVVDTQRMSYMERVKATTYYVRILRLAFVTLTQDRIAPILNLTCRNFFPLVTEKHMICDDFESLSKTRDRIQEWLRVTGGKVLSCETTAMRLYTGGERKNGLETSFTFNRSKSGEYWVYVIRVFLDGYYPEPPDEVLSPRPEVKDESCVLL